MKLSRILLPLFFSFYLTSCAYTSPGCIGGGCASCGIGVESPCACTDFGWRWNNCMGRGVYCAAFGNDGGLDS